jgi:hypothetical protein
MRTIVTVLLSILFANTVKAQYITEIVEYMPAPGQFINTESFGSPSAAQSLVGGRNGIVSLGAFGGYIVFKFSDPVENDPNNPYGIDFTVFGNPSVDRSEAGIVSVMKDENNNGLPDDTWYELAGSDYYFPSAIKNYQITYTNPGETVAADVPWIDNPGNEGFVYANEYHSQPYYPLSDSFPDINPNYYTLTGSKIVASLDLTDPAYIRSLKRAFGYADNQLRGDAESFLPDNPYTAEVENMGGDSFDISWAVDENGNYIDLNEIDFIKIHCAVNADMAWLGEVSTEVSGALDIVPDGTVSGIEDMVVIKDLPPVLHVGTYYPLETFAFHRGRLLPEQSIDISVDLAGATIDENNVLSLSQTGTLTLTASFSDNAAISSSMSLQVTEPETVNAFSDAEIRVYPNPAEDFIQIRGIKHTKLTLINAFGKTIMTIPNYSENEKLNISRFNPGLYFLKITKDHTSVNKKIIISKH